MSVYKRKERGGQWWFRIEDATGKRVNRPGGATKQEALRVQDQFRREQQEIRNQPAVTELTDFIENTYLPEQAANISSGSLQREIGVIQKHLLPFFVGALSDITPESITRYKNERLSEVSSASVRKELSILRHIINMAIKLERLNKSPFSKVKMPRDSTARVRYLDPSEWQALLSQVPETYKAITVFLVNTGCRRSEALGLRWSNVDLHNGFAVIEKDKRHKEKVIPLNAEIVELFKTLPRHSQDDRVFFWIPSGEAVSLAFHRATGKAGIVNFRLHDLRHTAASHLAMSGHDIKTIQEFLGHSDIRQTTRYAHIATKHLKTASDSLLGKFSAKAEVKVGN